jgi:uncharacterized membrane protein
LLPWPIPAKLVTVWNGIHKVFTFKTIILWLHLSAVVVWIGGMFFATLLLLPLLKRSTSFPLELSGTIKRTVQRFQNISWEAVGIIFLTGIFNLINVGLVNSFNFTTTYIRLVGLKLLLLVTIIVVQSFQSYRLLPQIFSALATPHDAMSIRSDSIDKMRNKTILLSILNLVLAAMVIYIGLGLRYQ